MQKLITIITAFIFLMGLKSQATQLNITATSPANINACNQNVFTVAFSGVAGTQLTIAPSLANVTPDSGTCASNSTGLFWQSLTLNNCSLISQGNSLVVQATTNGTCSLTYQANIDCHIAGLSSVNLVQSFSSSNSNDTIFINSVQIDSLTISGISSPILSTLGSISASAYYLTQSVIQYPFLNTGSSGNIQLEFISQTASCGNVSTDSITFQVGTNGTGFNYSIHDTIFINSGDTLLFKQWIKSNGCFNSCGGLQAQLKWQCNYPVSVSSGFCNWCQGSNTYQNLYTFTINNGDNPVVDVQRIVPADSAYELSCFNDSITWSYRIINVGNCAIDSLMFDLAQNPTLGNSADIRFLSLIPEASISISGSAGLIINTDSVIRSNWLCSNYVTDALHRYNVKVKTFLKTDTLYISFRTIRCSEDNDTLINLAKYYNRWGFVNFFAEPICGTPVPQTGSGLYAGGTAISGQGAQSGNAGYDFNLKLNYTPSTNYISVDQQGKGETVTFAMDLQGMVSPGTHVYQLLGCNQPRQFCNTLKGWFKATVFCDTNLRVPNIPDDVYLIYINPLTNDTTFFNPQYFQSSFLDTLADTSICIPATYSYYFDMSVAGFKTVLDSGQLIFNLYSCCGSDLSPTPYHVTFHVMPDPNNCFTLAQSANDTLPPVITNNDGSAVWLPLNRRGKSAYVLCPGCVSPGIIAKNYRMQRKSFGLQDSDNDGYADTSNIVIDPNSNWFTQNQSKIKRNFSGYGDIVEDLMVANFVDGDNNNGGYEYADLTNLGLRFNVLQLSRMIPMGLDTMRLLPDSIILYVDSPVPSANGCLDCADFGLANNAFTTQLRFVATSANMYGNVLDTTTQFNEYRMFFTTFHDTINNTYSGTLHDTINYVNYSNDTLLFTGFYPGQNYRMRVVYNVCGNYSPSSVLVFEDVVKESDILNRLFFSGTVLNQFSGVLPQQPNSTIALDSAGYTFDPHHPTDTLVNENFMNTYMFFCEATGGLTYFVSNSSTSSIKYDNLPGCDKQIRINNKSTVGGGKLIADVFPYEYRPPSLTTDEAIFTVPSGYAITNSQVRNFIRYGSGIYSNFINFNPPFTTGTDTLAYNPLVNFVCLSENNNPSALNDTMFAGDQENETEIIFTISPDSCRTSYVQTSTDSITTFFGVQTYPCLSSAQCGNTGFSIKSKPAENDSLGINPNLLLASIGTNPATLSSDTVCWNSITILNQFTSLSNLSRAENVFIAIPNPPAYFSNWHFIASNQNNTPNDTIFANGNIMGIRDTLSMGISITGNLCAVVNSCPPDTSTNNFDINFGWLCDSFPSAPYTSNSACEFSAFNLQYQKKDADFFTEGKTPVPNQYVLCDTVKIIAPFTSTQEGYIYPDSVTLTNLLPGLIVTGVFIGKDTVPPLAQLTQLSATTWSVTPSNMNAIGYSEGGFNGGNSLVVIVEVIPSCQYAVNETLPNIILSAIDFCGVFQQDSATATPGGFSWSGLSDCTDCFTLTKTANADTVAIGDTVTFNIQVCSHNAATDSIYLSEILPSPTVFTFISSTPTFPVTNNNFPADTCINYTVTGTYTATGSCPNPAFTNTATLQSGTAAFADSVCVNVIDPCFPLGTIILASGSNSVPLLKDYGDTTFYVMGLFTVNDTLRLHGSTVYTAPSAQIVVTDSGYFRIDEATIIQGCSTMWRGIVAKQKSDVIVYGQSIIADADTGIYAERRSYVDVITSSIINCYKSISQQKSGNSAYHQGHLVVEGSTFGLFAPAFKPTYPGQSSPGLLPWCGIELNDWIGTIGNPSTTYNTFYNMQRGIYGDRSRFTSTNNYFEDIKLDSSVAVKIAGSGFAITSLGKSGQRIGTLNVTPAYHPNGYTMYNCNSGIYTNYSSLDASSLKMRVTTTGFMSTQCKDSLLHTEVNNNIIETGFRGIYFYYNASAVRMFAKDNIISVQNPNITNGIGISIQENTAGFANYQIQRNQIDLFGQQFGISSNTAFKALITDNPITQYYSTGSNDTKGIIVTGGDSVTLSCNTITSLGYPTTNPKVYGIYFSGSKYYNISCNKTQNHYYGNLFDLDCSFSDSSFKGNEMNSNRTGLYLTGSAKIGVQNLRGNLWVNNNTTTFGAINWNVSNLTLSLFQVNNTTTQLPNTPLANPSNGGWFTPIVGNIYSCGFNCNSSFAMQGNNNNNSYEKSVAQDAVTTTEFVDEGKAIAKQNLYEALAADVALRNSDAVLSNFYAANDNTTIGKTYDVEEKIKEAQKFTPANANLITTTNILIESKIDSLNWLDSLSSISPGSNFDVLKDGLYVRLQTLEQTKQNLMAQEKAIAISKLNDASSINASILPDEIPQQNDKFANYINVLYELYGLDTLQYYFNDMLAKAQQCPSMGGNSVYVMRGFISLFDETITYDDEAICLQYGIFRKANEPTISRDRISALIVPNPANNSITVSLSKSNTGICKIEIADCFGRTQIAQTSDCKIPSILVNTTSLHQGMYFVKVALNDSMISKNKLIINR